MGAAVSLWASGISVGPCENLRGFALQQKITRGSMWLHLGAKGVSKSGFLCAEFRGCPVLVSRYGVAIIVFRCDSERAHAKLDFCLYRFMNVE